jgi:N-acetylmuramoyl-L-alanine amidase
MAAAAGGVAAIAAGQQVLDIAQQHLGEKYVLGVLVPKDNPNWTGPWDCSEFASWIIFQAASRLYGCNRDFGNPATADAFTGFWNRDAKSLGQIIPIDQAARTPGANVLRIPQPGTTGHIVVSDGFGGTIEAHSSKDGVIRSTLSNRRWDTGILVPGIAYTAGASITVKPPDTVIYRLTTPLMTSSKVQDIQQALRTAGFDPGAIDGEFGPHTQAAVVAFQLSNGLLADGEVGRITAAALGLVLPKL